MNAGLISSRYARALYRFAAERGTEERVYEEMLFFRDTFAAFSSRFRVVFGSRGIAPDKKLEMIRTAAGGETSDEFLRFAKLVLAHRRESLLEFMALQYIELYRRMRRIRVFTVTTAVPLERETEERIRAVLSQGAEGPVEIVWKEDPSVRGGFVLDTESFRLDASIAGRLQRLKKALSEGTLTL